MDRLLRLGEAAAFAGRNERTIRRWAESGLLHPVRVGSEARYRLQDLLEVVQPRQLRPEAEGCQRRQQGPSEPRIGGRAGKAAVSLPAPPGPSRNEMRTTPAAVESIDSRERRRAELMRIGRAYAASATASWDDDVRGEARAQIALVLQNQVGANWTADRVQNLVEDLLRDWEEIPIEYVDEDDDMSEFPADDDEDRDELEDDLEWEE